MAYNESVPLGIHRIKDSQSDFIADFEAIADLFAVNHYDFGDANEGKHQFAQVKTIDTHADGVVPSTEADEGALYASPLYLRDFKADEPLTFLQTVLNFRRDSNADPFPINDGGLTPELTGKDYGYERLPSGILLKWKYVDFDRGTNSTANAVTQIFDFNMAGTPDFSAAPFIVHISNQPNGGGSSDSYPVYAYLRNASTASNIHIRGFRVGFLPEQPKILIIALGT